MAKGAKMETPIGRALHDSPRLLWVCTAAAAMPVACDFVFHNFQRQILVILGLPYVLAAEVCLTFAVAAGETRDSESFGFRWSPRQSWSYWARLALIAGAILGLVLLACFGVLVALPGPSIPPPLIRSESAFLPTLFTTLFHRPDS